MKDIYQQNGYDCRETYLEALAEDNDVPLDVVQALAETLGESEDFDGLVMAVQDAAEEGW